MLHQPPQQIRLEAGRQSLVLVYPDAEYTLPAEYLRVYSPSAEVRGHGRGQAKLQTGKAGISITDLQPAGNYALKITFSDGHDSGLYSWRLGNLSGLHSWTLYACRFWVCAVAGCW